VDFPVFGQNAGVNVAAVPAPPNPAAAPQQAAGPDRASSGPPSGFLELARQIQSQNENPNAARPGRAFVNAAFGDDGFGFDDLVDVINPLQHIPIISTIYRALTGDKIDVAPRLAGGALYGGFFGLISAAVNAAIEETTGHDIGDSVRLALFGQPENAPREPVMFASAQDAPPAPELSQTRTPSGGPGPWYAAAAPGATPESQTQPQLAAATPAEGVLAPAAATATPPAAGPASVPKAMPRLTPAQLALLHERDAQPVSGIAPAAGPPQAGPPQAEAPKSGPIIDLTPGQEALLLRSLGLAPPGDKGAGAQASDSSAPPSPALGDSNTKPAGPLAEVAPPAAQAAPATPAPAAKPLRPVQASGLKPSGQIGAAAKAGFADKMKYGLDRYFAHPTPINKKPPHPDVIR